MQFIRIPLLLLIITRTLSQLLITSVSISNDVISQVADYNFQIIRYGALSSIPPATIVEISFPNAYATSTVTSCRPDAWVGATSLTCTYSQLKLLISGGFPSASNIENFGIVATGIRNPSASKTYSAFSVRLIHPNNTTESGSGEYSVTITTANATCSLVLNSGLVFGEGLMSISYISQYINSSSVGYTMKLSMLQSYPSDPTNTDINPILSISSTMSAPYLFEFPFTNTFNITMLMPPSTQPEVNFIYIMTSNVLGNYDKCYLTISGVQPNQFNYLDMRPEEVQSLGNLQVSFLADTPILPSDMIRIDFGSSEFDISQYSSYATFTAGVTGQRQVTKAGQVLTIRSIASFFIVSQIVFELSGIEFPYSNKPQSIIIFIETENGYIRNWATYTYSSRPGLLVSPTYTCPTNQIGYTTSCTLLLTLKNQIRNTSYIQIKYPSGFTISNGYASCTTSGTNLNAISNCNSFSITNAIRVSSMVASGVAVIGGGSQIQVMLPGIRLPIHPATFSLTISTKTSDDYIIDTSSVSLATAARALVGSQISISSTSSTTSSITNYTLTLSLPISLGIGYKLIMYIPFNNYSIPSVNNNQLTSTYNATTSILVIDNVAGSLMISGFMTHESTQPVTLWGNFTSNNTLYFFFPAFDLAMQLPREVNVFSMNQSNYVVGRTFRADMIISDLKVNDVVKFPSSHYALAQPDCSSNCQCGPNGNIIVNSVNNYGNGVTALSVNLQNLGYISSTSFNITVYTTNGIFMKQTRAITIRTQVTNVLNISASQNNPYFKQSSVYTFSINMTTAPPTDSLSNLLEVVIPNQYTIHEWSCIFGCTAPLPPPVSGVLYFTISSTIVSLTIRLTNPVSSYSAIQMTSSSLGDMDYGTYLPTVPCNVPCRSCSTNKSQCLSCYLWSSEDKLRNGTCVSSCSSGQFYNNATNSCQICHSYCLSCVNASTNCYTCKPQYFYFQFGCLVSCPASYYPDPSGSCSSCSTDCLSCSSSANCNECANGSYLFQNSCWASCQQGTYINPLANECLNCSANCATCDPTGCSQCQSSYYLYNKLCYSACPAGLFKSVSTCESCQSPCSNCFAYSNNCTSCVRILNSTLYYYLNNRCYQNACPTTYYISSLDNVCLPCRTPCLNCNSTHCLTCQTGLYFYNGLCTEQCISGTYPLSNMSCHICPPQCINCTSPSACLACNSPHFLYNSTCILDCPDFFYKGQSICEGCRVPCLTCTSALTCKSCTSLAYYNGSCYSSCPQGYYSGFTTVLNQTVRQCKNCVLPCLTCTSALSCLSCTSNLKLYNSMCQSSCPTRFYDLNGICFACSYPCLTCNSTGCLTCANSSLYLQRQECLANCTDLHPNNLTMKCEPCAFPCSTCTWPDSCLSCQDPYIFYGQACIRTCPAGKYNSNKVCVDCPEECSTCYLSSDQMRCPTCKPGYNFYGYICVAQCPVSTTLESPYCLSADCNSLTNCSTCSNLRCLECQTNFTLNASTGKCEVITGQQSVIASISQIPVPFPFFIATVIIFICAFLLRMHFDKMFAPIFIYCFVGIAEIGVISLWLALIYMKGIAPSSIGFMLKVAASTIGGIYVFLNILNFILYLRITRNDPKYRTWQKQDNKCASVVVTIVALILSFRFSVLKYSKLGHLQKFSATLTHDSKLSHENTLAYVSIILINISTVVVAAWVTYLQTKMNYLFFTSIQATVIAVIMLVLSIIQSLSPKGYTLQKKQEYKQGHDSDGIDGQSLSEMMYKMGIVHQEYHEGKEIISEEQNVGAQNQRFQEEASENFKTSQPLVFTKAQDDKLSLESDIPESITSEPISNQTIIPVPTKDQRLELESILLEAQKRANDLSRPIRPAGTIRKQAFKQLEDQQSSEEIQSDDEPPPINSTNTGKDAQGNALRRQETFDLNDFKIILDIEERKLGMKRLQQLYQHLRLQEREQKELRERLERVTKEEKKLKQKQFQRARQLIERNQMSVEDKISNVQQLLLKRIKNEKNRKEKILQMESRRKQERAIKVNAPQSKTSLVYPINQQIDQAPIRAKNNTKQKPRIYEREHIEEIDWVGSQAKLNFQSTNSWKIAEQRLSPSLKKMKEISQNSKQFLPDEPEHQAIEIDHWPLDPELEQKIDQIEARAEGYIRKPKQALVEQIDMELQSDMHDEEILYEQQDEDMREGSSEEDEGGKVLKVDENIKVPKRRANRSVINLAPSKKSVL